MASGRQVKCAAGGGGDGGRIGGERVGCPFGIVGEPYQSDHSCLALLVPTGHPLAPVALLLLYYRHQTRRVNLRKQVIVAAGLFFP